MSKKYHIITFGCQMNKNDSEHIAGMLEYEGYKLAEKPLEANLLVFNTCAVREKAERRVYGQVERYNQQRKKHNLDLKIYLAGCMPAYNREHIKKNHPIIDGFIDIAEAKDYPPKRENCRQAWVTIMQGCNNFCSYCIVPYTRGRETSRSVEAILQELKKIDFTKHDTVYLLGQNVNSFNGEYNGQKITFAELLQLILKEVAQIPKLSFLTSHPKDMSPELIEVIAQNSKIDRELHFPLQAGSDKILAAMNRGYTYQQYSTLVKTIRQKVPDVRISTDIIVGFPGESEADFQKSLQAIKELFFHRVICAAYSIRSGTKAADLPDMLSEEVKADRLQKLLQLVEEVSQSKSAS